MPKIFLSYRRQESPGVAGRIYDRLCSHFGDDAVFMDVDSIPLGVDFREHIASEVGQCEVMLAVIGPRWVGVAGDPRRLDNPGDFVRIELEGALKRRLPVIPILIDRTPMPSPADLPDSLASLAFCNAIEVDHGRDFRVHVDRLIRGIEFHLRRVPSAAPTQPPPPLPETERSNSIGMTLVRIEPGSFLMGSTKEQIDQFMRLFPESKREWFDHEQPQHPVKITRPFLLGIHPVTQGQYQAIMGSNPSHFRGSDDLPVETVSWLDVVNFCNKLSEKDRRTPFYHLHESPRGWNGYRLPRRRSGNTPAGRGWPACSRGAMTLASKASMSGLGTTVTARLTR